MMKQLHGGPILGYYIDEDGQFILGGWAEHNDVLYTGADILAKVLGGRSEYAIAAMYIEFANGAFTDPTFNRDATNGHAYYDALTDLTPSDFLRVPIDISPSFTASGASYSSNIVTFNALTAGSVGIKGQAFGTGSVVVGGALVAMPTGTFADDIVYSRFYFGSSNRMTKAANQQITISWPSKIL